MPPADLAAYVMHLRASRALTLENHMGRAGQQLALDLVRRSDPALSEALHALSQTKPYAVSGLLLPETTRPVLGRVAVGDRAWVRVLGLQADVVAALDRSLEPTPTEVEIDHTRWQVESVSRSNSEHPWAGRTTTSDLIQRHRTLTPATKLTLEFATPTGFHSAGLNVPLPQPALVWGSLLRQWNDLSLFPLPEDLTPFIAWQVMLNRYRAETQILRFKQGSQQIGFTGQATFAIATRNEQLERTDPALAERLSAQREELGQALGLLAEFAFYCGVGIKTTTGMGMVRQA